jgi:hypothetical protein
MEQAEEWTSKKNGPEAQEQRHGTEESIDQTEAWSRRMVQKHGANRRVEQAEARCKH